MFGDAATGGVTRVTTLFICLCGSVVVTGESTAAADDEPVVQKPTPASGGLTFHFTPTSESDAPQPARDADAPKSVSSEGVPSVESPIDPLQAAFGRVRGVRLLALEHEPDPARARASLRSLVAEKVPPCLDRIELPAVGHPRFNASLVWTNAWTHRRDRNRNWSLVVGLVKALEQAQADQYDKVGLDALHTSMVLCNVLHRCLGQRRLVALTLEGYVEPLLTHAPRDASHTLGREIVRRDVAKLWASTGQVRRAIVAWQGALLAASTPGRVESAAYQIAQLHRRRGNTELALDWMRTVRPDGSLGGGRNELLHRWEQDQREHQQKQDQQKQHPHRDTPGADPSPPAHDATGVSH